MIIINHTLSFAPEIEKEAITWIKAEYIPLLKACPVTLNALFYEVILEQTDAQTTFALQVLFRTKEEHKIFCDMHKEDFAQVLYLKFTNNFGAFTTTLKEV